MGLHWRPGQAIQVRISELNPHKQWSHRHPQVVKRRGLVDQEQQVDPRRADQGVEHRGKFSQWLVAQELVAPELAAQRLAAQRLVAQRLVDQGLVAQRLAAQRLVAQRLVDRGLAAQRLADLGLVVRQLVDQGLVDQLEDHWTEQATARRFEPRLDLLARGWVDLAGIDQVEFDRVDQGLLLGLRVKENLDLLTQEWNLMLIRLRLAELGSNAPDYCELSIYQFEVSLLHQKRARKGESKPLRQPASSSLIYYYSTRWALSRNYVVLLSLTKKNGYTYQSICIPYDYHLPPATDNLKLLINRIRNPFDLKTRFDRRNHIQKLQTTDTISQCQTAEPNQTWTQETSPTLNPWKAFKTSIAQ